MPCHSRKCTMIISVEVKEINMTRYPQEAVGGHGGRVVTLSPPTSAAGVRSPSWP